MASPDQLKLLMILINFVPRSGGGARRLRTPEGRFGAVAASPLKEKWGILASLQEKLKVG